MLAAALISINVLSLLAPTEVILRPAQNARLTVRDSGSQPRQLRFQELVRFTVGSSSSLSVDSAQPITVEIPGVVKRTYDRAVTLRSIGNRVEVVATVDLETAVSWAVRAESMPLAKPEALKALGVVARSWYLAAKGRHGNVDACDTTHCQFLGSTGAALKEVIATRDLVLLHDGRPLEAMHHANCGGYTKSLADTGMANQPYPYYSVKCPAPAELWTRTLTNEDAQRLASNLNSENLRIEICRRLGWDAIPGNNYRLAGTKLQGKGRGHGVGLCQEGAAALAGQGMDYVSILHHFFPDTRLAGFR